MYYFFTEKEKKKLRLKLISSALTGLLSDPENRSNLRKENENCPQAIARLSVEYADAVIQYLDKKI